MSDKCALCRGAIPGRPATECSHPFQFRHVEAPQKFVLHEDTLKVMPEWTGPWMKCKGKVGYATNLETGELTQFGTHLPVVLIDA